MTTMTSANRCVLPRHDEHAEEEALERSGSTSSGGGNEATAGESTLGLGAMELLNEELRHEIAPRKLLRQFSLNIPPSREADGPRSVLLPHASAHAMGDVLERLERSQQRWRRRPLSESFDRSPAEAMLLAPPLQVTVARTPGDGGGLGDASTSGTNQRSDTFEVKFGEGFLGIEFAINEARRQVMVKSVQDGAWSRTVLQIPPGASITRGLIVDMVNGRDVTETAPQAVLEYLQYTERPLVVKFRRCEASMVTCKLCECRVDAWSLDEHTNYCVMSRRYELEADQINNALARLATSIKTNLQSEAFRASFTSDTLHFYNALRVISIQASSCDVTNVESFSLCSRLMKILDRIRQQEPQSSDYAVERGLKYCHRIRNMIHMKMSKMRQTQKVMLQQAPNDGRAPFQRTKSLEEMENSAPRTTLSSVRKPSACRVSIQDFQILKPISKGAYGKVYLARKKTTGDQYAIKVLAKEYILRKKQMQHIETERDILVQVESPFVVKLFWTFQTKRNLFLVMEYLPGGDFMSLLECIVQLEEQVARVYIAEVALALNHLHQKGCVHRDLKPDNILISSNGHIKLTDFGLSEEGVCMSDSDSDSDVIDGDCTDGDGDVRIEVHRIDSPEQLDWDDEFAELIDGSLPPSKPRKKKKRAYSHTFGRCGTPDYLSPEIILGRPHGPPVDYWALGVILYEMLVGFPPFNDETVEAIFNNILERQILWPDGEKSLSNEAMDLINRLLELDPSRRLDWEGMQQHPFFNGINWNTLLESTPPFVPTLEGPNDTSYFNNRNLTDIFIDDEEFELDSQSMDGSAHRQVVDEVDDATTISQSHPEAVSEVQLMNELGAVAQSSSLSSSTTIGEKSIDGSFKVECEPSQAHAEPSSFHAIDAENNLKFPSGMYGTREETEIAEAFRSFSFTNMNALAAASRNEAELIADTRLSEVESSSSLSILI